ncbi:MAG: hypothetical protein ACREVG_13790, partial [Burkholderiales bacterium]
SLTGAKAAIAGLVIGDPALQLFPAEFPRRRQFARASAQSRGKEEEQFFLLLLCQRLDGGFDFSECAHGKESSMAHPVTARSEPSS